MFFLLVALGVYMGWAEQVYAATPSKPATLSPTPHDWYAPLPEEIPEMFLRPELIPVESDGLPAVEEAERVLGGKP